MEYQENGLGTYDFHARMYDPQIGRSFQPDPMADVFAYKNPYAFLANNPVMFIDPTGMLDVTTMYFDDERFQAIYPANTSIPRDWHRNTGKNFRGAGGFYAAFNPRGQWSAENARNTWRDNYKFEKIDKYTDSYFYSKYTGLRYKGTKYEGSYLMLSNVTAQERFPNGELLYGVNFWQPSSNSWTSGEDWTKTYDPNMSQAMNRLYSLGVLFLINTEGLPPSDPMLEIADAIYKKQNFLGNNIPMPLQEAGSFVNNFQELVDKNRLNPNFTYFRFIDKLNFNSSPVYRYGVIPTLIGTPQITSIMKVLIFILFVFNSVVCSGQSKIHLQKIEIPTSYFTVYYSDSIPRVINGKLYTGFDTSSFINDNEKLIVIETFVDGFKTEVKTFYDNNVPECHFQFKKGKRDGISKGWYKSGKVLFDNQMKQGKSIGIAMSFYENGNRLYVSDDERGIFMKFHENGKIAHLTKKIIDSTLCGGKGTEETSWYKNGQLLDKCLMNCGKQTYRIYANDTTVPSESIVIGMPPFRVGKYSEYYVDGKPKLRGQFEDGNSQREANIMIGTWKYWDEKEKLTREEFFEKGKLIKINDYIKEKKLKKIND